MTDDDHPDDLIGAYVIEACTAEEARSVAEHASRCPTCAAEIAELSRAAEWIGVSAARAPAAGLRSRVLSAALAARPAGRSGVSAVSVADHTSTEAGRAGDIGDGAEIRRLVEPYREQVEELDRLLSGLSQPQWLLPTGPHRSVRDSWCICGATTSRSQPRPAWIRPYPATNHPHQTSGWVGASRRTRSWPL